MNNVDIFRDIYNRKLWGGSTPSGPGSDLEGSSIVRRELPAILNQLNIKTILDIPCGTFNWMKDLDYQFERYIGMDILEELIISNTNLYSSPTRSFILGDLIKDRLPLADMVLCRDCLAHLSINDVQDAILNMKGSGAKYLAITTFPNETYSNRDRAFWKVINHDNLFRPGDFRPINLCLPPFSFPKPLFLIDEEEIMGKHLGVWECPIT